jgi:sugar fermentation stimulation protein A
VDFPAGAGEDPLVSISSGALPGNVGDGLQFRAPLVHGRFREREKRFLVHVRLDDGRDVVAHTNNTGSMRGCLAPDAGVWLSPARDPRRKLAWTLELVETVADPAAGVAGRVLVGVNTLAANRLVAEALAAGLAPGLELAGSDLRPEVRYGDGSRADFLLTATDGARTWIEVKNVSLVEHGHARFPDSPTARGRKHLEELATRVRAGDRAALVFCVQRGDAGTVGPADDIDPAYGALLREVVDRGVRVVGVAMAVTTVEIRPAAGLPVIF